jgi:hypothetical protein
MKRTTLVTLVLAAIFVMQFGASVTFAQVGPALLDPRDGMYLTRIINLTGEQLSIAVTNDTSNSAFVNPYPALYSTGFSSSNNLLNNQQNIFTSTPIKLDTMLKHNPQKQYAFTSTQANPINAYWEGMINLCPLIPASNENSSYATYSGHFSQAQRLTITTVNNPSSLLNGAYIQFGYNYSTKESILWGNVYDFAASSIKSAANLATACEDGDVEDALSSGSSAIKSIISAVQTSPVTASLNSAATLTQQPVVSQTSKFTAQTTTNYAQAMAYFAAANGGGLCITDYATNNQIYTLASAKQAVVKLTASDKSVRYFTAPAYYIYIKNVEAPTVGDINECTIAIIEGWVYNLAGGMSNYKGNANLQDLTPLQLMYYAGSKNPPIPLNSIPTEPAVNVNVSTLQAAKPVTIISATISYIGG